MTFLLIIAGGLVTSTGSGLSVPDWPLSYGQWMPPMVGGIRYEHTHRMIASGVGLMTLVLALWLGFSEKRAWVRWTGVAALGMVVAQGILGGVTVLFLLPAPISIIHACLGQTFFALVVSLAFFMSKEWVEDRGAPLPPEDGSVQRCLAEWAPDMGGISLKNGQAQGHAPTDALMRLLFILVALIYTQLILGATFRHTKNLFIMVSHVASAFLILLHAVLVVKRAASHFEDEKKLLWPALAIGVITVVQMSVGMGAFIYQVMLPETMVPSAGKIFFVTAHQALGAVLLGLCVFFLLRVFRLERVGNPNANL